MSASVSSPVGVVEVSRIARPATCPLCLGVSSARNCASRLVSWRMAGGYRPRAARIGALADRRAGEEEEPGLERHDAEHDGRRESLLEAGQPLLVGELGPLAAHRAQPRRGAPLRLLSG